MARDGTPASAAALAAQPPEPGWRRPRLAPSLAEVYRTVPVHEGPWWRKALAFRLHTALGHPPVEPGGDPVAGAGGEARDRHGARPGAGVPGPLLAPHRARALGAVRGSDRGVRPGGGDRLGDRAEPAVRDSPAVGYRDHGARRADRLVPSEQGLPAARGACRGAHRHDRGVLPVRDFHLAPRPGRGGGGLRAEAVHSLRPREAVHRDRDPRRDGDAAQLVPAFVGGADEGVRGDAGGQADGAEVRVSRFDHRLELRAVHQRRDPDRGGRHLPPRRPHRGRRDPGGVPAPHAAARRGRGERRLRPGAARVGAELDAHGDACGSDRDGGFSQYPDPAVAAAADHPPDRDCAGGAHRYLLRRKRYGQAPHPEPGDPEPAAVVRGVPARVVHVRPREDGRVRQRHLGQGAGLRRGRRDRGPQHLAPRPDVPRLARVMYDRILVPLEHSYADDTILAHVRELARRLGSSLVLIHVADGWVARNIRELDLRESEEMREDRAYLESISARLQSEGFDADAVLAAGDPAKEIAEAAVREKCDLIAMATHGHRLLEDVVKGSTATALRHLTKVPILMVRAEKK